jgi:hypothetical protein
MNTTGVKLSTQLSLRDLGAILQETTQSMYGAKDGREIRAGLHPGP